MHSDKVILDKLTWQFVFYHCDIQQVCSAVDKAGSIGFRQEGLTLLWTQLIQSTELIQLLITFNLFGGNLLAFRIRMDNLHLC